MTRQHRTHALIPARGGSKGILNKNIVPLCGKPLLAWTIEAARAVLAIDYVWVSTDSPDIASVATQYGAHVIERPTDLALDTTPTDPVIAHAMAACVHEASSFDSLWILLQPTSPLRTAQHIRDAIDLTIGHPGAAGALSVCEASSKWLKLFRINGDGFLQPLYGPDAPYARRQDLPAPFLPNGAIYVFWEEEFRLHSCIPRTRMLPYVMVGEHSLDIDNADDLAAAAAYLKELP